MKLPIPFLNEKKEKSEYYLALLLMDEKVSAVILIETLGKLKIVNQESSTLSDSLETISYEELLDCVDKTISRAEEVLPPHIETHSTVFGVKQNWVDEETKKIKKEYLAKLKKICDSLDLSPLGFMVNTEAVANLMQQEEGAPLSAVLAEIGKKLITLTLVRGGKIVETVSGDIDQNTAPETVDTLLKKFTIPVLPARIMLLDSTTSEKLAQQFIIHQWSKSLPFLHVPQITPLPSGFGAKAVTYGAANQMGFDMLDLPKTSDIQNLDPASDVIPVTYEDKKALLSPHKNDEQIDEKQESFRESGVTNEKKPVSDNQFGFLINQDIATQNKMREKETKDEMITDEEQVDHQIRDDEDLKKSDTSDKKASHLIFPSLLLFPSFFLRIPKMIKLPSLPFVGKSPFIPITIVLILGILILAGVIYVYITKVHTTVTLLVTPKMIQQDENVTFSNGDPNNFSQNIIAAQQITTTVDGSLSTGATGKKDIGDKAKGTITLYNNSQSPQTITSGTTISSNNNLSFSLDNDISIASASGDVFSGTKPGTADTNITAKDIGTQYNLPSGTTFTVSGGNNLAAKNANAFSGGTKKTVTVIAPNDISKLKNDLIKNVASKATDGLSQKAGNGQTVLPIILSTTLQKSTTDKNAGDQASQVTLTGTVLFTGLSYMNDDLIQFAKNRLKNHYHEQGNFSDNSIKNNLQNLNTQDPKVITGKVSITVGLLPDINTNDVTKKLHQKSLKEAKIYLSTLPQIASSTITFSPSLPLLPTILPLLPNQITVRLQSGQ